MIDLEELGVTTKFTSYGVTVADVSASTAPIALMRVVLPTTATLTLDANTAPWVFEAAKKLEKLGRLRRNWNSYDGLPLSSEARVITFDALGWLKNQPLPVPSVVLCSDGTVQLEWRSKGRELEVGFSSTATLEYAKVDSEGHIEEGEANTEIKKSLSLLTSWLLTG